MIRGGFVMFRLARCRDLIELKARYREHWILDGSGQWGLKQMGTLFCIDAIERLQPTSMLEVGAGFSTYFDEWFGDSVDYWAIDKAGFYDPARITEAEAKRRHTTFVDGLLGEDNEELPDDFFDLVFSISVLEHVTKSEIEGICREMFRVTSPGGTIVHSIDSHPDSILVGFYFDELREAGFELEDNRELAWSMGGSRHEHVLLEPLDIIYTAYGGYKEDMWENLKDPYFHFGTVLVEATKPAAV